MEETQVFILSLCRDPVLVFRADELIYRNGAAEELFSKLLPGREAARLLPRPLLLEQESPFFATATICGRDCSVAAADRDGLRYLTVFPEEAPDEASLVSGGMLTQLNNCLCNLGLAVEQISRKLDTPDGGDCGMLLSVTRRSFYSVKRLAGNLTAAMLFRERTLPFFPEPTELTGLCRQLTAEINGLFHGDRARLSFSGPGAELRATVDGALVQRLLLNLISNSLEHTPADGALSLSLFREEDRAVFMLRDDGCGIAPEVLRTAFSRCCVPADRNHLDRTAKAGLGLWLASRIARLHGGMLTMQSSPGMGTCVRAAFPMEQPGLPRLGAMRSAPADLRELLLTELAELLDSGSFTGV